MSTLMVIFTRQVNYYRLVRIAGSRKPDSYNGSPDIKKFNITGTE